MDNYDCFINDSDLRSNPINSPGPSSGYSSADEGHHRHLNDPALFRDVDSPWRGQSPFLNRASDPCMGGGVQGVGMTSAPFDANMGESYQQDVKNNLSFDDIMDTLWDPFGTEMSRLADFASTETITDMDMTEAPNVNNKLNKTSNHSAVSSSPAVASDSSLLSLLRGPDRGPKAEVATSAYSQSGSNQINTNHQQVTPGRHGVDHSPNYQILAGENQNSVTYNKGFNKTVSNIHQHMANMSDLGILSDESDYILQIIQDSSTPSFASPQASRVQVQNSTIMNGVFGSRSALSNVRTNEPTAIGRIKNTTAGSQPSSAIRQSVTIPASLNQGSLSRSLTDYSFKNGVSSSNLLSRNSDRSVSTCDMRGGRSSSISLHPGLDDHRYTLKPAQSQSSNKLSRQKRFSNNNNNSNSFTRASNSSFNHGSSTSSLCSSNGKVRANSILEAFLRSTRPMDPNKGSNAVLAAEGLTYLQNDSHERKEAIDPPLRNGGSSSGMLLKKLLTGEIDQREILEEKEEDMLEDHGTLYRNHIGLSNGQLSIESPLTDGFGLDVDLNMDDSHILGTLLESEVANMQDSVWLEDLTDQLGASELEDILKEQTRQDNLLYQHYSDNPV